jgi:aerobic-type carbon monoxide dehydrogenase small subunit (CoxS/CutS family)
MATDLQDTIGFTLNGRAVRVRSAPNVPLLYVLRDELDLKASRFGCGQAACGACTVIVDGRAVTSCDLPVDAVAGAVVETAESLASDPPHALVDAFLEHQAGQCGYCLPGILMAAKALLDETALPDRAHIAEALDGNLCRCGSHGRILDAVESAARKMSAGA